MAAAIAAIGADTADTGAALAAIGACMASTAGTDGTVTDGTVTGGTVILGTAIITTPSIGTVATHGMGMIMDSAVGGGTDRTRTALGCEPRRLVTAAMGHPPRSTANGTWPAKVD